MEEIHLNFNFKKIVYAITIPTLMIILYTTLILGAQYLGKQD